MLRDFQLPGKVSFVYVTTQSVLDGVLTGIGSDGTGELTADMHMDVFCDYAQQSIWGYLW